MSESAPKPEKRPGHREAIRGIVWGAAAVATSFVPFAGIVLGWISMKHGNRSRAQSERLYRGLGNFAVALGGLGFFLGLLMLMAVASVIFLQGSDIINLGAP